MITPRAALLLQCVRMTSPSWMRLAPIFAISSTAISDLRQNIAAFSETRERASSREEASWAPRTDAWTPFQRDTAVGRDARSVSHERSRSLRNASRESPS